jgi:hypothetical protein
VFFSCLCFLFCVLLLLFFAKSTMELSKNWGLLLGSDYLLLLYRNCACFLSVDLDLL